jgi:prepilin-type N-terminal cleavage/methylation domain-containing protein
MHKTSKAFTIVELLIVVVVIAILASISLVTFSRIQARARDNIRYHTVKEITKLLEIYKTQHGSYPSSNFSSTNVNGCTNADGWSYSWASSNGTWLSPLVDSGTASQIPTPPINDCSSYVRYIYYRSSEANCTEDYPNNGYIIQVIRAENTLIPDETVTNGDAGTWKLCPEDPRAWGVDGTTWVFYKYDA